MNTGTSQLKTDDPTPPGQPAARGGWAPGPYLNKCRLCQDIFIGDKRAWHCAPCAYDNEPNFMGTMTKEQWMWEGKDK